MKKSGIALVAVVTVALSIGSAAGATAQSDAEVLAPVEFTSKASYSGQPALGQTEMLDDGVERFTGQAWQFRFVETSDPRVDGTITATVSSLSYPAGEDSTFDVGLDAWRIENDGGAWQELPPFTASFPWSVDHDDYVVPRVFAGEGDYEGLTLAADETFTGNGFELHGFIFQGELPVAAEPWSS